MKKFTIYSLGFLLSLISFNSFSQNVTYGRFKGDITAGYAYPFDRANKFGFAISFEPKYNITNNIAAGLRFEVPVFLEDGQGIIVQSWAPAIEYYFGHAKFRPFVGALAGLYQEVNVGYSDDDDDLPFEKRSFAGGAVRAGFQIGSFRLEGAYNLVKDNNYLSVKFGGTIGGRRK